MRSSRTHLIVASMTAAAFVFLAAYSVRAADQPVVENPPPGLPETATAASPGRAVTTASAAAPTTAPAAATPTSPIVATARPPLFTGTGVGRRYAVIRIDGPLMSRHGTVVLKRGIDFAKGKNADLAVIYLDTPGGMGTVMLGMRDAIIEAPMPTLGYVKMAYSAGALLALATDRIYMTETAHIGDAIPITMSPGGGAQALPEDLKEKFVAPMKKEFSTTARINGYPVQAAEAMVDIDVDLPELGAPKGKILILDAPTAIRIGLASGIVRSIEEAVAAAGLAGAERLDFKMTTADRLASFLSQPTMSLVLIVVIIAGIFIEVKTPGFGLGGMIALAALFLFFWANWYANLAHWLEIVLFLIGVGLLVFELTIPGFGIFGISGILCIAASVFLAMFRLPPEGFDLNWLRLAPAVKNFAYGLALGVVTLFFMAGALRHSPFWRRVSLGEEMETAKGFAGVPDLSTFVGREGIVLTDLRPVGTVRVGARRLDAITEGEFIGHGTTVKIVGIDGAQVVARATEDILASR